MRVFNPIAKNNPPIASLAAAIKAKKTGAKLKGNPNFATSSGNQDATSNSDKFFSESVHGIPNLLLPKSMESSNPPTIRGIAINKFEIHPLISTGVITFLKYFDIIFKMLLHVYVNILLILINFLTDDLSAFFQQRFFFYINPNR